MKAKKALSKQKIKSNLVKIDFSNREVGCQYGLEFNERDFYDVISILRQNDITYGVYEPK